MVFEGRREWALELCVRYSSRPGKYKCVDCSGWQMTCCLCMVECHICLPYHHIQVCHVYPQFTILLTSDQ